MNFKKTVVSLFAAGSILVAGLGGATAQSDTSFGQAVVNPTGTFNVFICHSNATQNELINFGTATLSSQSPTTKLTANMVICYTDTKPDRGAFTTNLSSSDFDNINSGDSAHMIEKSNLKPTLISNVGQGQWGIIPGIGDIGDIGGLTSTGAVVASGGGSQWGTSTFESGSLEVGFGYPGVGTASDYYTTAPGGNHGPDARSSNGSWAPIGLELTVPSTTVGGTYQNVFTVDVVFSAPGS